MYVKPTLQRPLKVCIPLSNVADVALKLEAVVSESSWRRMPCYRTKLCINIHCFSFLSFMSVDGKKEQNITRVVNFWRGRGCNYISSGTDSSVANLPVNRAPLTEYQWGTRRECNDRHRGSNWTHGPIAGVSARTRVPPWCKPILLD